MTRMEELLRAATRDSAAGVSPHTMRPLDLTDVPFDRPRLPVWPWRRRLSVRLARPGILLPVLAALAVVAVVAASLALPRVVSSHGEPAAPAPGGVPPYYAALTSTGMPSLSHPTDMAVWDTWTGQPLATVTPPPGLGTFDFVASGAIDDRTWVVGAAPWKPEHHSGDPVQNSIQPVTMFLMTFDPEDRVIQLKRLPGFTVTAIQGSPGAGTAQPVNSEELEAAALSPDGSRLAVAVLDGSARKVDIHVISLDGSGHAGTWVIPGSMASGALRFPHLSWNANDRVLAVGGRLGQVAYLDTTKPSGTIQSASRILTLLTKSASGNSYACSAAPVMTSDGTTLTCPGAPTTDGYKEQAIGIVTYSAQTGRPLGMVDMQRFNAWVDGHWAILFWASPEEDTYLATTYSFSPPSTPRPARLTVVSHGRVTGTIPLPAGIAITNVYLPGSIYCVAW